MTHEPPSARRDRIVREAEELAPRLAAAASRTVRDLVAELHWQTVACERARAAYETLDASYRTMVDAVSQRFASGGVPVNVGTPTPLPGHPVDV
jgi:hypothetical protein